MNYKMIGRFIARIMSVEAVFMLPALLISIANGEQNAVFGFLITLAVLIPVTALLFILCRKASGGFYAREGLVCVSISWIIMSLFGCLPFWFSGEIKSFIDAFLRLYQALPLRAHQFCLRLSRSQKAYCIGAASAIGSAAWACLCFCSRLCRRRARRPARASI